MRSAELGLRNADFRFLIALALMIVPLIATAADPFRPPEARPRNARPAGAGESRILKKPLAGPGGGFVFPNDGQIPQDVVVGDWNRDGQPDLAIAYAYDDAVRWFYGAGNGTFIPGGTLNVGIHPATTDDLPRKLFCADFDGDGFLDLAVLCSGISTANTDGLTPTDASLGILYGTPDGGFEPFRAIPLWPASPGGPTPQYATTLAGAVINSAGGILLAVGFMDSQQISLLYSRGGRRWDPPRLLGVNTAGAGPIDLALADLDGDGQTELIVLDRKDAQVWQGTGPATFGQKTTVGNGQALTALALADWDQDGAWDLGVLDGGAASLQLLMGLGADGHALRSTTIPLPAGSAPWRLLRDDLNLDGRDDLALLFMSGGGQILLGQPAGAAQPLALGSSFTTAQQPCALADGDFNRDGWPDLAVVNQGDQFDPGNPDLSLILTRAGPSPGDRLVLRNTPSQGLSLASWLAQPRGLGWDAAHHNLWTIDRRRRSLVRLNEDGVPQASFPLGSFSLTPRATDPCDIAIDGQGDLWLTDRLAARVLHLSVSGNTMAREGFPTDAAGLAHPAGIAFDPAQGRLLVSDEIQPLIKSFSPAGALLATYSVAGGQPLRDLAWNNATGRLWGVPEREPGKICELTLDDASSSAAVVSTLALDSLAAVLQGQTIRSLAVDTGSYPPSMAPSPSPVVAHNRFWALTDSGALVEATFAPALTAIHELSVLRPALAAAAEPEGTLLLAGGGPLATLYRVSTSNTSGSRPGQSGVVQILGSFSLCGPADPPLHICGLARTASQIAVLDGIQSKILLFDLHGASAGSIALPSLAGRRPQGLYSDPASGHFWITTPARLLEFDAAGGLLGSTPIPATNPPTSLGQGRQAGELAVLSSRSNTILTLQQSGGQLGNMKKLLFQTSLLANPFQALTALPGSGSAVDWRLLGTDPDAVVLTVPDTPTSAVLPGWARYE